MFSVPDSRPKTKLLASVFEMIGTAVTTGTVSAQINNGTTTGPQPILDFLSTPSALGSLWGWTAINNDIPNTRVQITGEAYGVFGRGAIGPAPGINVVAGTGVFSTT